MSNRLRSLPLAAAFAALSLSGCGVAQQVVNRSSGGNAVLEVVNSGSQSVYSLQASSCSNDSWGRDHLGSSVIRPGETKRFTLDPGCWDFRADFDSNHSNGNERVQRGVRIGSGSSWTWTVGG